MLAAFAILSSQVFGQDNNCFENSTGLYWPLKIGSELKYTYGNDSKVSAISGDSIEFDGKYYLVEVETYSSGKTKESYWRIGNGAVFNYNKEKGVESMELPASPDLGVKWTSTDKTWTYEIVSLSSTYTTPFCDFIDLLEVKIESAERMGMIYRLFYKRGVGLVGLNVNETPYSYILPDKEMNEQNFMAYGCENAGSEKEIQTCTYSKIFEHIKANYKAPKKIKKGRILVKIIFGKDGNVDEVKIVETIPNGRKQEEEVTRVIKSLPQFKPAQVNDGQTIRASITVPFKF